MLYTLGIETNDFEHTSLDFIQDYFKDKENIQFDCETTGMDVYTSSLMCFQLGDFENQFVISPNYLYEFKNLLETKLIIGQNLKFDLRFLYHNDIYPNRVFDTFLAEGVLFCGISIHKKGLDSLAKNRLGITLDKSIRNNIGQHELIKKEIQYSGDDVKYLEKIKESQEAELTEKDLHLALKIENNFVLCLAYIEYCGFKLDKVAWKSKMNKDRTKMESLRRSLDEFILVNNYEKFIQSQGDLFSGERVVKINWDSPKQVIEFFKFLKIPVTITEKGKTKDSVEAPVIKKYIKEFPILDIYIKYKEQQKLVGTYGQSFLDQINPVTGRIHTNFKQILDTARISSGGKDKSTKEEYINFQNIPADKETRSCFVSEEGNMLIDADFSGQEQVVLANKSLDPNLLKFYDEDLGDIHSFTASNMYPELRGIDLKEIKEKYKDKRQKAKSAGFAINYGGNETTIANNENISIEDARNIYNQYFIAFPGLRAYFDRVKLQGLKDGYILMNNVTRRKSYIYGYEEYLELKGQLSRNFWDRWKILKAKKLKNEEEGVYELEPEYLEYKDKMGRFFKIKGEIERKSLNYPIQSTSAEITKISAILMFKWIRENNYFKIVKFCNQIHDENLLEAPSNIAEEVSKKLEECMFQAGAIYCKRVPLKADTVVVDHWEH